jgi:drug/metabolite transporter (DMT)-like permease
MASLAAGLALFFVGQEEPSRTAPDPTLGNVLAALSGATWALTVTSLRALARRESSGGASAMAVPALGNLVAFVLCVPFAWPLEPGAPMAWVLVTFLGAFQIGLAYLCLTAGVRVVSALEGSLLLLLEPVLNPVWAWLAHGERPGPWAIGGAVLILGATAVHAVRAPRRPAPPEVVG